MYVKSELKPKPNHYNLSILSIKWVNLTFLNCFNSLKWVGGWIVCVCSVFISLLSCFIWEKLKLFFSDKHGSIESGTQDLLHLSEKPCKSIFATTQNTTYNNKHAKCKVFTFHLNFDAEKYRWFCLSFIKLECDGISTYIMYITFTLGHYYQHAMSLYYETKHQVCDVY